MYLGAEIDTQNQIALPRRDNCFNRSVTADSPQSENQTMATFLGLSGQLNRRPSGLQAVEEAL